MLTPLRDLGPAGTAGAGRRVGPPACGPHGARSRGGRSPRARPRSACGGATGLPRLPRRPASAVQISERLRTPVRPRAAGPIRAPCLPACDAPELGPRPAKGLEQLSCPFCHPLWSPNTDCRRPHPGPAQDRLAGYGRTPAGLETLRANVGRPLWLLGKGGGPARGGPGPARSD